MPYIDNSTQNTGAFIPTTTVYDISQINQIDVNSPDFKQLIVVLYQNINNIANVLNAKSTGIHVFEEIVTSDTYPANNANDSSDSMGEYNQTYFLDNLGPGVTTINHGITINAFQVIVFTDIYGAANDTTGFHYYPLGFASADGAHNIELRVNQTQIVITNNSGVVFNQVWINLNYLKT